MAAQMYLLEGSRTDNAFTRTVVDKVFRRKYVLFGALAAWTFLVGLYVFLRAPSYEHEIRFLVRNNRVATPITPESNDGPIYRDYVDETMLTTEIEMLSSSGLMRKLVERLQLAESSSPEDIDEAVKNLKKDIKIGRVQKANMIKVTYSDSDPHQVESVLSTLAEGFLDAHLRAHSTSEAHEMFDRQARFYEERLEELRRQLTEFQASRGIVLLGEQKDLSVRKLLELEAELKSTETARTENARRIERLKEQLSTLEERITTHSRNLPNQYSIERLNTMLVELNNRRTQLLNKYQPDDRLVREVETQIEDTKKALHDANSSVATERSSDINPVRQSVEKELVSAQVRGAEYSARIAGLRHQANEMRGSLAGLRESTAEDEQLNRQIREAEANFFLYSKKREDARIENVMDRERISNVILVEPPRAPAVPLPRISLTLVAGYMLGCLLISGVGLLWSLADQKVYTTWELEGITGSPVLAAVPFDAPPEPSFFLALNPRKVNS